MNFEARDPFVLKVYERDIKGRKVICKLPEVSDPEYSHQLKRCVEFLPIVTLGYMNPNPAEQLKINGYYN